MDGKLAQFMSKLADVILLNVLLVACSIPIVTAFYYVMLKLVKNEESYVFRSFLKPSVKILSSQPLYILSYWLWQR